MGRGLAVILWAAGCLVTGAWGWGKPRADGGDSHRHRQAQVGLAAARGLPVRTQAALTGMAREGGQWLLAAYPSPPDAQEAARAAADGEAAGRWVQIMLADGKLDTREQALVTPVLPSYSGLVATLRSARSPRARPMTEWEPATLDGLARLAFALTGPGEFRILQLTLFRRPAPKTAQVSAALAGKAIGAIFSDLHAATRRFPELARFDQAHAPVRKTASDTRLWYAPNAPTGYRKSRQKIPRPTIGIGFSPPRARGTTQVEFPQTIFPHQNLAVWRVILVDDPALARFVTETVHRRLRPLRDLERALGGAEISL